jgi:hypothetical protein
LVAGWVGAVVVVVAHVSFFFFFAVAAALISNSQAHHFRGFAYLVTEGRDLPDSGGKKRWVERVFLEKR